MAANPTESYNFFPYGETEWPILNLGDKGLREGDWRRLRALRESEIIKEEEESRGMTFKAKKDSV